MTVQDSAEIQTMHLKKRDRAFVKKSHRSDKLHSCLLYLSRKSDYAGSAKFFSEHKIVKFLGARDLRKC